MSNELTLVMKDKLEDLVPSMLAWNNVELLSAVKSRLANYRGVEYTDAQVVTAKKDRAELNAFCTALNSERIRIGKVYNAPYERFKREVDEVIGEVKSVVNEIDAQVKKFETAKEEQKQQEILAYYDEVIGEFRSYVPYERFHDSKWLNASVSMKSIRADIDKKIEEIKNAMVAIEAMRSPDEAQIKAFYFRTLSLSSALTESQRLADERARIAELAARKEAEKASAQAEVQAEQPEEPVVTDIPRQTVRFAVTGTLEQLKALRSFLIENKILYRQIKEI